MCRKELLIVCCILVCPVLTAQNVSLVKDINTGGPNPSGFPDQITPFGSLAFFTAFDREHGIEPWITDGTGAGTRLLKDMNPGPASSGVSHPVNVNATLYFFDSRYDGVTVESKLWASQGTEDTTILVQSGFKHITSAVNLNGLLLFLQYEAGNYTLWKCDGTAQGTSSIQTFLQATFLFPAGKYAYFAASNSTETDTELWRTDGTPDGTILVRDINPGPAASGPLSAGVLDSNLYFYADDSIHGRELWISDGTRDGTRLVRDIRPGASSGSVHGNRMARLGHRLYFRSDDGIHGDELWGTDGTSAGTRMVRDIKPGSGYSYPHDLVEFNGMLFFGAADGIHGDELWGSDGTESGTRFVKDLRAGQRGSDPEGFKQAGRNLFFVASGKLWVTINGTTAGTRMIQKPISLQNCYESYCEEFTLHRLNDAILFAASDAVAGAELWRSDGTNAGTSRLKDIARGNAGSTLDLLGSVNGQLVMTRRLEDYQRAIYTSDGSAEGTQEFVGPDIGSAEISGGLLWFSKGIWMGQSYTYELWKSDLTAGGTTRIPVPGNSYDPGIFSTLGKTTLFRRDSHALWQTDGTEPGTRMVFDMGQGDPYVRITSIVAAVDHWMILVKDEYRNFTLWRSDGTTAGTHPVRRYSGYLGDYPEIVAMGINVFFGFQGSNRHQLWVSDGTDAGTIQILSLKQTGPTIEALTPVGHLVYFRVFTTSAGVELWKTDGTANGTVMVKDIDPGRPSSDPELLTPSNDLLYFTAKRTLWKTDGTAEGTVSVSATQVCHGEFDTRMGVLGGKIAFAGCGPDSGTELWISDGTSSGTRLLKDIWPGPSSSVPSEFTTVSNRLFFVADDGIRGDELWKLDAP